MHAQASPSAPLRVRGSCCAEQPPATSLQGPILVNLKDLLNGVQWSNSNHFFLLGFLCYLCFLFRGAICWMFLHPVRCHRVVLTTQSGTPGPRLACQLRCPAGGPERCLCRAPRGACGGAAGLSPRELFRGMPLKASAQPCRERQRGSGTPNVCSGCRRAARTAVSRQNGADEVLCLGLCPPHRRLSLNNEHSLLAALPASKLRSGCRPAGPGEGLFLVCRQPPPHCPHAAERALGSALPIRTLISSWPHHHNLI